MGCRCAGVPMPSMVSTWLYSLTCLIFLTQERTSLPSRMTVHAPQTPLSQPTLVPVSPMRRSTLASVSFSGSHMNKRFAPLMLSHIFLSLMLLPPLMPWSPPVRGDVGNLVQSNSQPYAFMISFACT